MLTDSAAPPPMNSSGGVPFEQRRWWSFAVGAAALWIAMVHATLWWIDGHPMRRVLWGDETTYLTSATRLLAGDPGWWPESLWPSLYPQFLSGLMWLGGGSLTVVVLAQSLLLVATAVRLSDLTWRLTGSRAAGAAAAVLTLGYPPLVAFCHYLWPEVLHLFLFVALLWLIAVRWRDLAWCAVAGVVLGLALLSKSLLLPFVPVLLLAAARGSRPRESVLRAGVVLGMAAVTVAPSMVSNARRTGSPMIGNSAAFNIWVGLNDAGRENFRSDVAWTEYQRWEASSDTRAGRERVLRSRIGNLVSERGWVTILREQLSRQYFRFFDIGCYLTDQLSGGAAQVLSGAGYIGIGPQFGRAVELVTVTTILLLLVAAPMGLVLVSCGNSRWVRVLIIFLAYNLALFLWLHVKTRYRIQILPVAFVGVGCLVAWVEAGCRPRPSAVRIGSSIVVIALLIWFALG